MTHISGEVCPIESAPLSAREADAQGFSLVEFMISSLVLLVVAAAIFTLLSQLQRTASYQTEVQGVLENTRIAMESITRILQQAGNDPRAVGFAALTITNATEVRIRSDLTGSAPASPDQGDPDGDTGDSGEDVIIRYNAAARTIELVPTGGVGQPIASNISAFLMQYFDHTGAATILDSDVRKIRIIITGASPLADPQTRMVFSLQLSSDVQLANRQ
jgi:Tfp pilus assembly protein PilW